MALAQNWRYPTHRPAIRAALLAEQRQFCDYSERFVSETDQAEIEHFDPRLKETPADSYWNWYAVLPWFNRRKPNRIEDFEPLPKPYDPSLAERIGYDGDLFLAVDAADQEAINLIKFLGWNSPELVSHRRRHVQRVRDLLRFLDGDFDRLRLRLQSNPEDRNFLTALESEFGQKLQAGTSKS